MEFHKSLNMNNLFVCITTSENNNKQDLVSIQCTCRRSSYIFFKKNFLFHGEKIRTEKNIGVLFIYCKSKIKVKINSRDL